MERILTFDDLRAATGFERAGDVTRCLRQQGIHVFLGKAGIPWTTIDWVKAAEHYLLHGKSWANKARSAR